MNKTKIFFICVIVYEFIKILFLLITPPLQLIPVHSLSWYVASTLLCFPLLFCFYYLINPTKYSCLLKFLSITKLLSVVSYTAYFLKALPEAFHLVQLKNYRALSDIFFMLIFFILDVIIGIVFVNIDKKVNSNDDSQEGTLCK